MDGVGCASRLAACGVSACLAFGSASGCAGSCAPTGAEPMEASTTEQLETAGSTTWQDDAPSTTGTGEVAPDLGDDGPTQPLPPQIPPLGEGCGDGIPTTGEFCYVRVEIGELPGLTFGRLSFAIDLGGDGLGSFGIGTSPEEGFGDFITLAHLEHDGSFRLDPALPTWEWFGHFTDRDFDGDGRNDVIGIGASPGWYSLFMVHRNLGETVGELVSEEVLEDGASGHAFPIDVDGDGVLEVVAGVEFEGIHLRRRVGGQWTQIGSTLPLPACNWLSGNAHADFNEDGFEDFVTTGGTQACDPFPQTYDPSWYRVAVFFSDPVAGQIVAGPELPMGGLHDPKADDTRSVFAGDFDRDGHADILVPLQESFATSKHLGMSFLRGHGDGTFDPAVVVTVEHNDGFSVSRMGDFDGDGNLDMLGGRKLADSGPTELAVAYGAWPDLSFHVIAVLDRSSAVTIGDVNGDGVTDVLMTDASLTPLSEPRKYYFALISSP
ncbi:FG-GAP repeat domain-containing protein [Paraliomyxa miuraensis]|uniref:FG-GAP repeat domain-containing protein n=1 Tax=Paraliomyxa miuraensis TaxID=376150 RepID=UPI0022593349|nr:VCBS repeat-containing protein [Paraliomyxa miuraensis]MCX4244537.1 VCBS repeat-containing protein [Paraliomyxa miuraensis]